MTHVRSSLEGLWFYMAHHSKDSHTDRENPDLIWQLLFFCFYFWITENLQKLVTEFNKICHTSVMCMCVCVKSVFKTRLIIAGKCLEKKQSWSRKFGWCLTAVSWYISVIFFQPQLNVILIIIWYLNNILWLSYGILIKCTFSSKIWSVTTVKRPFSPKKIFFKSNVPCDSVKKKKKKATFSNIIYPPLIRHLMSLRKWKPRILN